MPESGNERFRNGWDYAYGSPDIHKVPNSAKEAGQPKEEQGQPRSVTAAILNRLLRRKQSKKQTQEDKQYRLNVWTFWIQVVLCFGTIGAFGAAIWYASIAAKQEDTMTYALFEAHHQTIAAQHAAESAKASLKAAQDHFVIDQRPYVLAKGSGTMVIRPEAPIELNIQLINWGKSISLKTTLRSDIWFGSSDMASVDKWFADAPVEFAKPDPLYLIPDAGNTTKDSPAFTYTTIISKSSPSKQAIEYIKANNGGVKAAGRIWYTDLAGNHYRTDFCYMTLVTGAVSNCPSHNEVH